MSYQSIFLPLIKWRNCFFMYFIFDIYYNFSSSFREQTFPGKITISNEFVYATDEIENDPWVSI